MTTAVAAAPKTRARASNNPRRLEGLDGRSAHSRRRRDVIDGFVAALGGADRVTDPMMSDIVRASDLTLIAERARADALRGGTEVSVSDLIRLEGARDRAVRRLNLPSDHKSSAGQDPLAAHIAARYGHQSSVSPGGGTEDEADEIAAVAE